MVDAGDDVLLNVVHIFLQGVQVRSQSGFEQLDLGIREGALECGLNVG